VTGGTTPLDYVAWRESTLGRITERLERAVVFDLAGSLERPLEQPKRKGIEVARGDSERATSTPCRSRQ
jgi:hypothetical protein